MTIPNRGSQRAEYRVNYGSVEHGRQRGVVLVVSLIFLIALTAVASALMLNTTTDMKMSGASEMKVVANQEAFGAMDELIFRQVQAGVGQVNNFNSPIVLFQNGPISVLPALTSSNTKADIVTANIGVVANQYNVDLECPREKNPSSGTKCNIFQVQLSKSYGRNNNSVVVVNAGVLQKVRKN